MIANYTDHAANERTFLAWIRTGLAVAAFGFFLIKLNVFVDVAGGSTLHALPAEAGAFFDHGYPLRAIVPGYSVWHRLNG